MNYPMRDLSLRACSLAALLAACGDNGSNSTEASTGSASTGGTSSATEPGPTTGDPATGDPATTDTPTSNGPTQGPTSDPTTDSTTVDPTATTGDPTTDTTTGAPACPYTPVDGTPSVALELIANGFDRPVLTLPHPKQPDRLFIVEQGGHIKILEPGETTAPPDADAFLYVKVKGENNTDIGSEQGLLGFAFHPDFPDDPRVYINYQSQPGDGRTLVDEYKLDANNPDKVDPNSRRLVYSVGQPAGNHNGGMILFDSTGMLMIGMGDGGGSNDQFNTSRDPKSPLAKILRIDVEPDGTPDSNKACQSCPMVDGFDFTVPPDNPHVGDNAYAPEVWASGVRNPWRFSIDPATDTMYIADVGQGTYEEVSIGKAGADFGWNDMEGNNCFQGAPCDTSAPVNGVNKDGLTAPIAEYSHSDNGRCSITGAFVYHSCEVPAWDGVYFYGDYCSAEVFALQWDGANVDAKGVVVDTGGEPIIGSGYTGYGDVIINTVVLDGFKTLVDGKIYRVVPGA